MRSQVLAVDLLNPTPQAEARKHKLKVQHHTQIRHPTPPAQSCSDSEMTDPRTRPPLLLHGRQVPRLLHHHDRLLARANRRRLRRVLAGAVPAYGRQGETHRGVLVSEEVDGTLVVEAWTMMT